MNKIVVDILHRYLHGDATVEETNKALKEAGAGFHFEPGKNTITEEEAKAAVVGNKPEDANGYAYVDMGIGLPEKVHVTNGVIDDKDMTGAGVAFVLIGGKMYKLDGQKLVDVE